MCMWEVKSVKRAAEESRGAEDCRGGGEGRHAARFLERDCEIGFNWLTLFSLSAEMLSACTPHPV
jgi:hypothetical protein